MSQEFLPIQDSRSITEFFKPTKRQRMDEKREQKQTRQTHSSRRKLSTQMSIFGWLTKNRKKQNCLITTLPKNLIVCVYGYLRVFQIFRISCSCYYFNDCAKSIWNDWQFFSQIETDKLSPTELKKVIEKGWKMGHVKQLRSFYLGKNIKACRQKIKLKVNPQSQKPISGRLLQIFEISPQTKKTNSFLMDSHFQDVISSSFRSLTSIKLQSCQYIQKFKEIHKCSELLSLTITNNSHICTDDIRQICKSCTKIESLDLSGCESLDQGIFRHIAKLEQLKSFILSNYHQPFGDLQILGTMNNLTHVSVQNSSISDIQALQICKELPNIQTIRVNSCKFLTDQFLEGLLNLYAKSQKNYLIKVEKMRTSFTFNSQEHYEQKIREYAGKFNKL